MKRVALFFALMAAPLLAADKDDARAVASRAETFFNSYIKNLETNVGYEETIKWVDKSPIPTPAYKTALAKLYRDALKADPELGYGADAVICRQDWPDRGFRAGRVWIAAPWAFAQLASKDPKSEHVIETVWVKDQGVWQLDGTGPLFGNSPTSVTKLSDEDLAKLLVGDWREGESVYTISKNGKWTEKDGVGTWKVRKGVLLRSNSEIKDQPYHVFVLDADQLIYTDEEGAFHRLERAK